MFPETEVCCEIFVMTRRSFQENNIAHGTTENMRKMTEISYRLVTASIFNQDRHRTSETRRYSAAGVLELVRDSRISYSEHRGDSLLEI